MVNMRQMRPSFLQPPLFDLVFVFSFGDNDERDFAHGTLPYEATGKYHTQSCYVKPLSLIVHITNISSVVN